MLKLIITQKVVGLVARHAMTAAGAWLVAQGYADATADATALEQITGGAVAAAGLAWSVLEKRSRWF